MRAAVIEYRVYMVGAGGHIIGFEPLRCENDQEAIESAKQLFKASDIEVWRGPRLVMPVKERHAASCRRNESSC